MNQIKSSVTELCQSNSRGFDIPIDSGNAKCGSEFDALRLRYPCSLRSGNIIHTILQERLLNQAIW